MKIAKPHIDFIGIITSLVCALHCLALPLLLVWLGHETNYSNHLVFDLVMMAIGVVLIIFSLLPTIKATGNILITVLLTVGVVAFGLSFLFDHHISHVLFAAGGISWASAHAYKIFYLSNKAH